MKMPLVAAAALVGSVGLLTVSQISAQRPAAPPPAPCDGLALLNMYTVIQSSTKIKQAKDSIEAEGQAKKEVFKKDGERGGQLAEKFRSLPPNSPERQKLEREIMKMKADFELQGKKFERESQEKEVKVFYALSRDLHDELDRYAQVNGIQLILRYDPTPADLVDPAAIAQEVRKLIVYQRGLDITPAAVEAVNRRAPATPSTARAPGASGQAKPVQR